MPTIDEIRTLAHTTSSNSLIENYASKEVVAPVHQAVMLNDQPTIKQLLDKGAAIDSTDDDGNTPVHYAAIYGCLDSLKILVEQNADLNARNTIGYTPLHCAVISNQFEIIDELTLSSDVEVDMRDQQGDKPIHLVFAYGYVDIAKMLMPNFDANDVNFNRDTLLHLACSAGQTEAAEYLLELQASSDIYTQDHQSPNKQGNTPLHLAVLGGHEALVKLLLSYHANTYAKNKAGETPYDLACQQSDNSSQLVSLFPSYQLRLSQNHCASRVKPKQKDFVVSFSEEVEIHYVSKWINEVKENDITENDEPEGHWVNLHDDEMQETVDQDGSEDQPWEAGHSSFARNPQRLLVAEEDRSISYSPDNDYPPASSPRN